MMIKPVIGSGGVSENVGWGVEIVESGDRADIVDRFTQFRDLCNPIIISQEFCLGACGQTEAHCN